MAEQLLDRAEVGAALEQMRREGVAKAMRMRDEPAERRGVEAPAACREEERVLGAAREFRAAPRAGSGRRGTRPPRRAGRSGPSRPCRGGRGRAPARSRRRRGRGRPPRRCEGRPSRRARRSARLRSASGPSPSSASSDRVDLRRLRRVRQPARRLRRERRSGTRSGPSVKRRSDADRRELARDRRGRELAVRACAAELGDLVGEHADVDVLHGPSGAEPGGELARGRTRRRAASRRRSPAPRGSARLPRRGSHRTNSAPR